MCLCALQTVHNLVKWAFMTKEMNATVQFLIPAEDSHLIGFTNMMLNDCIKRKMSLYKAEALLMND